MKPAAANPFLAFDLSFQNRRHGDTETWGQGDRETRRHGDTGTPRPRVSLSPCRRVAVSPQRCEKRIEERHGSVLVGVLWCLALLFIIVIGVLHTARMDLLVTKHHEDTIQAHYLALAGVERAKALIYQDARTRSRNRKSHTRDIYDAPNLFRAVRFGRGEYSVFHRGSAAEGGNIVYGVSDEESRLNVNSASAEDLARLEDITPDVVAAIVDWRDTDNAASPGGAEADYYASLRPPRLPRNGPFETVRELLMVRGVSPQLLLGKDIRQNGLIDDLAEPNEWVSDPADLGWASMLTAHSIVENRTIAGTERVNIQTADEAALTGIPGISSDLAKAIVRYRNQQRFESIFDLLDVTQLQDPAEQAVSSPVARSGTSVRSGTPSPAAAPPGNVQMSPSPSQPAPGNPQANSQSRPVPSGPKLITPELFMEIADDVTTDNEEEMPGVLNVNSASLEALICLPGVTRQTAQAIINFRQSSGYLPNIGHLLKVPGITQDVLKQLAPRLSTRSETYRILSEGRVTSTGARQRIEEIVHVGYSEIRTLGYRENDL